MTKFHQEATSYVLIDWMGGPNGTGKYVARGQDVRTKRSEVHASWPRAKYFPVRPYLAQLCFFFFFLMERKLIHGSICLVSRAPFSAAVRVFSALSLGAYRPHTQLFSYGFPTKLREGTYGSYDNTSYQFSLRCRVKLRLRRRVSLISTQNHEIFTIYFSNNGKIKIMLGKCSATSLYLSFSVLPWYIITVLVILDTTSAVVIQNRNWYCRRVRMIWSGHR